MKYTSQFSSPDGALYSVDIVTPAPGADREVTLSSEPFATDGDDGEGLYDPLRGGKAKIGVVASGAADLMLDLYTGRATGVRVTLRRGDSVEWCGFVEQQAYDGDFSGERDVITISCDSGLAALSKMKYEASSKQLRSFHYVLLKVLRAVGCYTALHVHQSFAVEGGTGGYQLDRLYIAEQLFFDDKSDGQTDADVAWTMADVARQLCQWMGVVMTCRGDEVFLADYDALAAGVTTFHRVDIATGNVTQETLGTQLTLAADSYRGSDNAIAMEGAYNKVKVKCEFKTTDNLLPDIFDSAALTPSTVDNPLSPGLGVVTGTATPRVSTKVEGVEAVFLPDVPVSRSENKNHFLAQQFFRSAAMQTHIYEWDDTRYDRTHDAEEETRQLAWEYESMIKSDFHNYFGAVLVKQSVDSDVDLTDFDALSDDITSGPYGYRNLLSVMSQQPDTFVRWATKNISKLSFSNTLMIIVRGDTKRFTAANQSEYNAYYRNFPVADYAATSVGAIGGKGAYIVISGKVECSINHDYPFPHSYSLDERYYKSVVRPADNYMWARLQVGDMWWDGSVWTAAPCDFKLFFGAAGEKYAREVVCKDQEVRNNVAWYMGLDAEGMAIPMPQDVVLAGDLRFRLYTPMQQYDNEGKQDDMRSFFVWIKDLKIQAIVGDTSLSGRNDTDTVYTNDPEEDSLQVVDYPDVEFKVCTYDGKKQNFSSVLHHDNAGYHFVDRVLSLGTLARQEEHMVRRIVTQYTQPAVRLRLQLATLPGPCDIVADPVTQRQYVVCSTGTDYATATHSVGLREIKRVALSADTSS